MLAAPASADDGKPPSGYQDIVTEPSTTLVGVWEVQPMAAPNRATVEFTSHGKLILSIKAGAREITMEGAYKLAARKLTIVVKVPGAAAEHKQTLTITKLTETELATRNETGNVEHFTRKKK
jgi:uncharacterized protein (TIGR03066 family)